MSPELVRQLAMEVYGIELDDERCEVLSAEQDRLADALATATQSLAFDAPPCSHAAAVRVMLGDIDE